MSVFSNFYVKLFQGLFLFHYSDHHRNAFVRCMGKRRVYDGQMWEYAHSGKYHFNWVQNFSSFRTVYSNSPVITYNIRSDTINSTNSIYFFLWFCTSFAFAILLLNSLFILIWNPIVKTDQNYIDTSIEQLSGAANGNIVFHFS